MTVVDPIILLTFLQTLLQAVVGNKSNADHSRVFDQLAAGGLLIKNGMEVDEAFELLTTRIADGGPIEVPDVDDLKTRSDKAHAAIQDPSAGATTGATGTTGDAGGSLPPDKGTPAPESVDKKEAPGPEAGG